jgi:steroid delta-isomerase-like uncharacterized protein
MPADNVPEYQKIWTNGLNRGDVSGADVAFAPNCLVHLTGIPEPIQGVNAWKTVVAGFLSAFPDIQFVIKEAIIAGDRVAMRWQAQGTHAGPLGALPATGRRIAIDGLIFDRLADGKVVERWEQLDQSVMLQQLGVQ